MNTPETQSGSLLQRVVRHVCTSCCNPLSCSPENPRRTDWCAICGHRSEGQKRITTEGKWGSIVVVHNTLAQEGESLS
jgi:hypothetical protein